MDGWDLALLGVVAFVAVSVLVRLMAGHRDRLVERLREEMKQHQTAEEAKAARQAQAEGPPQPVRSRKAG
jgi:hypothetical protein